LGEIVFEAVLMESFSECRSLLFGRRHVSPRRPISILHKCLLSAPARSSQILFTPGGGGVSS